MRPGKHRADDKDDANNQRNDNRQPEEVVSPERARLGIEETMHTPNVPGHPFEVMTKFFVQRCTIR